MIPVIAMATLAAGLASDASQEKSLASARERLISLNLPLDELVLFDAFAPHYEATGEMSVDTMYWYVRKHGIPGEMVSKMMSFIERWVPKGSLTDQYFLVTNPGPLMIIRLPWPNPPWRDGIIRALAKVMKTHFIVDSRTLRPRPMTMSKDYAQPEEMTLPPSKKGDYPESPDAVWNSMEWRQKLSKAFAGDTAIVPKFWLYDWQGERKGGTLVCVRQGTS